jgi:plastocyanin
MAAGKRMKRLFVVLALALLVAVPRPAPALAAEVEIEILEPGSQGTWSFSPSVVTVPAGTTVTWRNLGEHVHSVTSQDQLFDSRLIDPGKSWSHTFTTPGTYRYFCVPNPWLKGVVVVTADDENDNASDDRETDEPAPRPTPAGDEPAPRRSSETTDEPASTPGPTSTPAATPTATPSPVSPRGSSNNP